MYIDSEVLGEGLTSTGGAILSYSSALAAALPMDDEADKNSNAAAPHNPDEQAQGEFILVMIFFSLFSWNKVIFFLFFWK